MNIEKMRAEELSLDRSNPRFGLTEATNEKDALEILLATADLKELWDSIAERGFEPFEPLVAMREGNEIVVLEGNRRLAAVKLLLNPELIERESARKRVPRLPKDKLETCRELPVIIVDSRDDAAGYIGFKHVNGPSRWSSIAKAKFGVNFYESLDGRLSPQDRMQSLTKQLGDSRGLIIRLLVAYKIIQQCRSLGIFERLGIDEDNIEFSHLYTLINNPDSREFIGLTTAPLSERLIADNPIPEQFYFALSELMSWLYGPNSVIKSQGVDRPRLQKVLASSEGIKELRTTGDLASAETVAGLRNEEWLELLARVVQLTTKANADAAIVVAELPPDDLEQAKKIVSRVDVQMRQLKSAFPAE